MPGGATPSTAAVPSGIMGADTSESKTNCASGWMAWPPEKQALPQHCIRQYWCRRFPFQLTSTDMPPCDAKTGTRRSLFMIAGRWPLQARASAIHSNAARQMPKDITVTISFRAAIPVFRSSSFPPTPSFKESSGSDDADHTHHTAVLMFQDVAMKHPVTGIVRDQGDLDTFARCQERRILPFLMPGRFPVPA